MNLNEHMKLIDRISYAAGNLEGIIAALRTMKKSDIDKQKLINTLEITRYNLENATKTLLAETDMGE